MAGAEAATCIYTCLETVCKPIIARSQNGLIRSIDSFLFLEGNYTTLDKQMKDLEVEADKLEMNIKDAELLHDCDPDVKQLDRRIKQLELEMSSIAKEYDQMPICLCTCTPNLIRRRYELGKKISQHLSEIPDLTGRAKKKNEIVAGSAAIDGEIEGFSHKSRAGAVEQLEKTWTVGITEKLEQLKAFVREDHRKVIGIHGVGGVGKSTLLREFNNYFLTGNCPFQVVIYVTVSNDKALDVEAIQNKITERLDLPWNGNLDLSKRAALLKTILRRKESFVVILDDVWKEFDVEAVGIPKEGGTNGKLIIGSRSLMVCIKMGSTKNNIKVNPLQEPDAWKLFKNNLTEDAAAAVELESVKAHAESIVKMCDGLPLALNVIGKTVASTVSSEDWKDVNCMIKSSMAAFSDVKDQLLAKLEVSYTLLKKKLQPCFLYCSLFPEDYSIRKDQLVECWTAEGFLDDARNPGLEDTYRRGRQVIKDLKDSSLLETGDAESEVKLHDIVREMAKWVACGKVDDGAYLVEASTGLTVPPMANDWEVAERISVMSNKFEELDDDPPRCNALRTLFLQSNSKLHKLPQKFFHYMPYLRVLDLSYTRFKKLPIEEGELPALRHLNLHNSAIDELPEGLKGLVKLIHLDLSSTRSLAKVPRSVLSMLSALQVLNMYCSLYGEWNVDEDENSSATQGVPLTELEGMRRLQSLGISVQSKAVFERFFKKRSVLKRSITYLRLEYCEGLDSIPISEFGSTTKLKELSIHSWRQLKNLLLDDAAHPHEDGIQEEGSLEVLALEVLSNLESISGGFNQNPYLTKLRELTINSCPKLPHLNWIVQLHSLEKLTVSECQEMEQVVEEEIEAESDNSSSFRKLETITLKKLPNLRRICCARLLLNLKEITIRACPNLDRSFSNNHNLKYKET